MGSRKYFDLFSGTQSARLFHLRQALSVCVTVVGMPLVIKSSSVVPKGGFRMRCEASGAEFRKHTVEGVQALYLEHCEANGYPLPTQQEMIELICKSSPAPQLCYDSDEPPFVEKAKNFVGEMARWAASGFKIVSQEILEARLAICQACPYWGGTTGGSLVSARCGKCGCSSLKVGLATASCGDKQNPRWHAV